VTGHVTCDVNGHETCGLNRWCVLLPERGGMSKVPNLDGVSYFLIGVVCPIA
jgi:hypothetical protein